MGKKYWVFTDFDGTVTLDDNQVQILDAFAVKNWREIEYRILEKGGKSRAYLPAIYQDFSQKDPEQILQFIRDNVRPDPYFPKFVQFCQTSELPLEIVSDGLHIYIEDYLQRMGLEELTYYSNVVKVDQTGFSFEHPYLNAECGKCGTCKDKIVTTKQKEGYRVIYIGDGISDECAAQRGDLIFAKGKLAQYCVDQGISYIPYETFAEVIKYLQGLNWDEVHDNVAQ